MIFVRVAEDDLLESPRIVSNVAKEALFFRDWTRFGEGNEMRVQSHVAVGEL